MTTYWNFDKPVYKKKRFVAKFVRKAPIDCTEYAKNNIPNYDTITSIPDDFTNMDFSETENMTKAFQGMNKISSIYDLYLPKATDLTSLFGPITPVSSPTTSNTVSITVTPNIYAPIANVLDGFMYMTRIKYFEGKKIIVNKPSSMYSAFNNCHDLIEVLSMFETKYITNFGHSFSGSTKLENICYMDTRRGTDFHAMFFGTKLSVINWNIDLRCATDVGDMFNSVNMSDKGVTFINVPRNLSIATTQLSSSKYTIKNYIETALNPEDVSDDDPIELS